MARSAIRLATAAAAFSSLVTLSCGGESTLPPPPPPPAPPPVVAPASTTPSSAGMAGAAGSAGAAASEAPAEPPAPALVTGAASPNPSPNPTVKFVSPTPGQVIAKDKAAAFAIKLDVRNWATATGSSHVHVILDNQPYKPIYDTKAPIKLSELPTGEALSEGQHVLVAFPSRANHESVKTPGAFAIVPFYVGKKMADSVDVKRPLFVFSRPKGEYKGDAANHVLVDFYVNNVTLAEGKEHVRYTVTGPAIATPLTADVNAFGAPLYLENLRTGTYALKGELLGGDGAPLAGPWNVTSREIRIDRESAEPPPSSGHAGPH